MIAIKVPLKDAEKVKKHLIKTKNLDFDHSFKKKDSYIYFPVKKKDGSLVYDYESINFKKNIKEKSFRDILKTKLSSDEYDKIKTAFDTVGDIAILEIDEDIRKHEKFIAETLLKTNKNVNTVLRKHGSHGGTFRTQKMKYLAGEKKKETIHKENNVKLKLDVEKVYFSVRLSTERKRISGLVKEREDILVMFSGCAPYPVVLSKNTKARQIYGIELNPDGHSYGEQNIKLNHLDNVFLINDDVNKAVPLFYQKIIGLKCANIKEQLEPILKQELSILELHTFESDFKKDYTFLKKKIKEFKKKGIKVWVHQPLDVEIDVARCGSSNPIFKKMLMLVDDLDINLTIHPSRDAPPEIKDETIIKNMKTFRKYYDNIYFENGLHSNFNKKEQILNIIEKAKIKNFCIDVSHFLGNYSNSECISIIKEIQKRCNTYFHLNDYNGTDSQPLYSGSNIEIEKILPLVTKGIVEIRSKNHEKPKEMISSFKYLKDFQKKFDRILMPLPKSAEDFLDSALVASRKGTVIHFYDFLNEDNFHEAHEKIDNACKKHKMKYKIINTVKCGQHSPRTYRICVDFKIL
ncbi:MAG: hypothetical protein ACLFPQ_05150 [Candidatus Woesearchaeota archaeon]